MQKYAITVSLCEHCRWMRAVFTPKGSRYLLCQASFVNENFVKYPRQPMAECTAFEPLAALKGSEQHHQPLEQAKPAIDGDHLLG